MRMLARSYYEGEPDVEWRMTDNEVVLVGELQGDEDRWGEYTVDYLGKLEDPVVLKSIKSSVPDTARNLYVTDEDLAKLLTKANVQFKKIESELDFPDE